MIISGLLEVVKILIKFLFDLLPDIPKMPATISNTLTHVNSLIFENLVLLRLVFRAETLIICVPLLIAIINLEHIWTIAKWILNKIPGFKF